MLNVIMVRVARPARELAPLRRFYCDGLGFEIVAEFEDHRGFDGVIFGSTESPYQIEFTVRRAVEIEPYIDSDDLLVFYLPDRVAWDAAVQRMQSAGFAPVPAINPYWDDRGRTFEDPDGRRIVLQHSSWPP